MTLRSFVAVVLASTLAACAASDTESDAPGSSREIGESSTPDELVSATQVDHRERTPGGSANLATETGGSISVDYELIDGLPITEGDVIVPMDTPPFSRSEYGTLSAAMSGRRWPGGVVPYVIESDLPDPQRVHDAIAHWQSKTNVRLVPRTTQSDYLSFHPGTGCSAYIGKQGGKQTINLSQGELPAWVSAIAINRSTNRTYYFFKRGFATIGSNARVDAYQSHFKFKLPGTHTTSDLVEVAFAASGHLFAWYSDGTVSEGTATDFAAYKAPLPYTLATGKTPADIAAIAISKTDQTHVYFKDGTYSVGTAFRTDSVLAPAAFTVAATRTTAQLANVDVAQSGSFVAYYTDGKTSTGTASNLGGTLAATAYPGHCAVGQTIHEIGHAVGLYHEQTRQDRDRYVTIKFENITSSSAYNFNKYSSWEGRDVGPYDYDSVMHYGSYSFSSNGQPTILKMDGGTISGQRLTLSAGDVASLAGMYPPAP